MRLALFFSVLLGIFLGGLIGYVWLLFGGFPADADRYGRIAVPGRATVQLPSGDIPLNHEDDVTGSGDTRSVVDAPDGMAVRVTPSNGDGGALNVDEVPGWLFSSIVNDRGHEPFARVSVEDAGDYLIETSADGDFPERPARNRKATPEPSSGPAIIVGAKPWNPLGRPALGATMAFMAVFALCVLPVALIRRFRR